MTATIKQDPLAARYAGLFKALAPGVSGFVLWSADLQRRASWGDAPKSLDGFVAAAGWQGSKAPAPLALTALGSGFQGQAWPLAGDSGSFVGTVALVWPVGRVQDQEVAECLAPALECLRQEVATSNARTRAMDLLWQQAVREWYIDVDPKSSIEYVLDFGLKRVGCQASMLYVPSLGLSYTACDEQASPEVQKALRQLRGVLDAQCGALARPLEIAVKAADEFGSASCPTLVLPTRCCGGRVGALIAFVQPQQGGAFSGQSVLRAHGVAFAATRRVDVTLDDETGLLSRGGLDEARKRLEAVPGSLLLVDIDRHQAINAVHGLDAGDMLLREVAGLLRAPLIPAGSLPARLHGGCFALLLPGCEAKQVAKLGQAMQEALAARELKWAGEAIDAGISCGITEIYDVSWPLDPAFAAADLVLRLAKERGRGRIEINETGNSTIMRRHDEIIAANDLREALGSGRLLLYAQKIVSLTEVGRVAGFELLVRMRDRVTGSIVPPKDFIAAAQTFGMLQEVDRCVVDEAFRVLAEHRNLLLRQPATFSINVSGASIGDSEFVDYFLRRLGEARVPPARITLEITEQSAVAKLDRTAVMMQRLREAGCGIAIDDFGTGANSMAYLRALPLTRLKIDGSFVRDMLSNPRSANAVRGIIEMARNFRLETVAEFVEDGATSERLRKMGVNYGQGYLFGKPEPMEAAIVEYGRSEMAELVDILNPR